MAFISRLLASRNAKSSVPQASSSKKCQSYNFVCHELFTFSVEQVQVAVFRECDFRGRKLLFDSKSVERVSADLYRNERKTSCEPPNTNEYVETTNGFCYFLKKPTSDVSHLAEMIFGSVAMSYRGTLYKIHSLDLPPRIVFSQVFPSPRTRSSTANHSSVPGKFEYPLRLDDSGGSSSSQTFNSDQSTSDHLSTASDTLLICRRRLHSQPLDVPFNSSMISSSGYGGELSTSSLSSGPQSMVIDDCCRLSNSFSENTAHRSLPTSMCLGDDIRGMRHRRASKLGLAIILEMTAEQEKRLENFIMQHIAVVETFLKRVRQELEMAYIHHNTFLSAMFKVSQTAAQWFVHLLTIIGTNVNVWHQLSNCDIPISIKCDTKHLFGENYFYTNCSESRGFKSLSKFFKTDRFNLGVSGKSEQIEKFVRDLCELVEKFDVKHTNFFLSTLMTGVLTHHLGWVTTLLPNDEIKSPKHPNLYIRQLCELYGCVGYPSKIAHTIITGKNEEELINKFINVLTYFIRCSEVKKLIFENEDLSKINIDNIQTVKNDKLSETKYSNNNCDVGSNIPSQLEQTNLDKLKNTQQQTQNLVTNESFQLPISHKGLSIKKMRTCVRDLSNLEETNEPEPVLPYAQLKHDKEPKVLFVLGADERLEMLNTNFQNVNDKNVFDDSDFVMNNSDGVKPSKSCTNLTFEGAKPKRAQSEEPTHQVVHSSDSSDTSTSTSTSASAKNAKYRYAGVKFNFQQYPQIFENYMKSKNIELNDMHLQHKKDFCAHGEFSNINFSKYDDTDDAEDDEPLQTPSNASELEYTSDLVLPTTCKVMAKEVVESDKKPSDFVRRSLGNTLIVPENQVTPLKTIELLMPSYNIESTTQTPLEFTSTLIRSSSHKYIPNIALQGLLNPSTDWQSVLKRDLVLSAKHPISGDFVEESVAVVGNVDSWTVSVISSHTYVIDKTIGGVPIGMSQLVANMLETLLKMWKLHTPPEYCLMHIEQKLREFCIQSKALAQMLLDTEYCTIDLLTSTLKLEANDVPLLMAVASVHTPEVTQKYGLRFQ